MKLSNLLIQARCRLITCVDRVKDILMRFTTNNTFEEQFIDVEEFYTSCPECLSLRRQYSAAICRSCEDQWEQKYLEERRLELEAEYQLYKDDDTYGELYRLYHTGE